MMRSMFSGVSGLRTHQTKMDVIGNNIANINTIGFKKSQVTFQEVFNQTIKGAGSPQGGRGGTNPQQVGLGVTLGSINTVHTKGPAQRTDNPTDMMIEGDGYFMVTDDTNFQDVKYTRAGNFMFDEQGYLVTPDGFKVMGYTAENGQIRTTIEPIKIDQSNMSKPTASTSVKVNGNLDSRLPNADFPSEGGKPAYTDPNGVYGTDVTIKDSLGNSYKVNFEFKKYLNPSSTDGGKTWTYADKNQWTMSVKSVVDMASGNEIPNTEYKFNNDNSPMTLKFGEDGKLTTPGNVVLNFATTNAYTLPGYFGTGLGADQNQVAIDFSTITQFANDSNATAKDIANDDGQKGLTSGSLNGFSVDASGIITGSFTNGEKMALGQVQLARFDNPAGLEKLGSNFFAKGPNSGEPMKGKPGAAGFGAIKTGNLEMSNVDLSMEFTEMITTQRGFQANSRIITTSDEMIQELVNIKR